MKCVIPGNNVKVFGRAIHCLSKIGEDLYIEPLEHGLGLRTVNSSRSAYACFIFAPTFFYHYDDGKPEISTQQIPDDEDSVFKCKITMKSCLSVFKSLATIEKTVEKCKIKLNATDARLIFTLYCKYGITKTYNLTYQETESLQAVFSKDLCPNKLVSQSRLFCEAVGNFQTTQEEISLIVSPEKVSLKNYVDDEPDPTKVTRTEMALMPEEFDDFTIGLDTEVTFCLKELRAILSFADACCRQVTTNFETMGKPIVFTLDGEGIFEANFVLATLADPSSSQNATPHQPSTSASTHKTTQKASREKQASVMAKKQSMNETRNQQSHRASKTQNPAPSISNTGRGDVHASNRKLSERIARGGDEMQSTVVRKQKADGDDDEDNDGSYASSESFPYQGAGVKQETRDTKKALTAKTSADDDARTDTHRVTTHTSHDNGDADVTTMDVDMPSDDEFEFIPSTPPTKKFKSMFFGSSQSQTTASQQTVAKKPAVILAEDTDEESD